MSGRYKIIRTSFIVIGLRERHAGAIDGGYRRRRIEVKCEENDLAGTDAEDKYGSRRMTSSP